MTASLAAIAPTPLLRFAHRRVLDPDGSMVGTGAKEIWTLADAFEGTQILGATGSGKSSGSGATIARAFLRAKMGGLVLTAKADEADEWRRYLRAAGRNPETDLVEVSANGEHRFNFLEYEYQSARTATGGSSLVLNLVSLFLAALSTGESSVSTADPYWNDALRELLTHTLDLAILAVDKVDLEDLAEIVRSAPRTTLEVESPAWQRRSRCFALLSRANERRGLLSKARLADLRQTVAYWLHDFPSVNERTRSIVVSSYTSKVAGLLRSPLRELLCTTTSRECSPEATHQGKVVILNLPVKVFGEVGRFAQVLYKTIWQRSTERRTLTGAWTPVFLWADEAQYFATREDMGFQQTARSKGAATVYLTQNLPNYFAALGQGGTAATESLLGNLQTKIFHANGDPTTNEWAQRLFGTKLRLLGSATQQGGGFSTTVGQQMLPVVEASRFTSLAKGGLKDALRVGALVFQGGRTWSTNLDSGGQPCNFLEVTFSQVPHA